MESEDQSCIEDVQSTSAITITAMDSNSTTTEHFEADMETTTAIDPNNKKLHGASTASTEPHSGTTLASITTQTNELDHTNVENANNGNDEEYEKYNAINLDNATWKYLRRSRCLGTSLRQSEQAYLSFGEDQVEDNLNDKSDDDEDEEEVDDVESSKHKQPSHLAEYFESIQKRFVADKKIKEYESSTCWIEPPDPVFPLQSSSDSNILLKPRLFIWAPNLLHPVSLTCPKCKSQLGSQGWNKSPHARGVLDVDRSFFIMSTRFRCMRCPVTLNAHDMNILKQLPIHLQEAFPAYMTHKSAISKTLVDMMRPLMNIMSPKRFTKYLKEIHTNRLNRLRVQCQKSLTIQKPKGAVSETVGSSKSTTTSNGKKNRMPVAKHLPPAPLKSKIQPILPNFSRSTPQFIPIYIPTSRPQHFIPPPPIPIRMEPARKPMATGMRPILPARRDIPKQFALGGASSMMMRMPIPGIKRRITAIGPHRQPRTCRTCKSQVCPGRAQSHRCKFASGKVGVSDALPTEGTSAPDTRPASGTAVSERDQNASPDGSDQGQSQPPATDASSKTPPPVSNSPPSPAQETGDIPSRPSEAPLRPTNALRPIAPVPTSLSSLKMPIPRLTYPIPSKRKALLFTQTTPTSDLKESGSLLSASSSDTQRSAESS